jgi:hypothetical protein
MAPGLLALDPVRNRSWRPGADTAKLKAGFGGPSRPCADA